MVAGFAGVLLIVRPGVRALEAGHLAAISYAPASHVAPAAGLLTLFREQMRLGYIRWSRITRGRL